MMGLTRMLSSAPDEIDTSFMSAVKLRSEHAFSRFFLEKVLTCQENFFPNVDLRKIAT